jgi:hypothetical protein
VGMISEEHDLMKMGSVLANDQWRLGTLGLPRPLGPWLEKVHDKHQAKRHLALFL